MKLAMLSDLLKDDIQFEDLYKILKEEIEEELPLEKRVSLLLYKLTLSPSYKGYDYLKEAILILCNDNSNSKPFTKSIYPVIAEKHDTTAQNIEKNIRFAIKKIYESNPPDVLKHYLGKESLMLKKPSNVKFITYVAEKFRLER